MMCDLSSSQSKHRLYHFCTTTLSFQGAAADLCCCFYIEGNFWRDCSHEIKGWEWGPCDEVHPWWNCSWSGWWDVGEMLVRCPHVTWLLRIWVITQLKQTNKQSCFLVAWFSGAPLHLRHRHGSGERAEVGALCAAGDAVTEHCVCGWHRRCISVPNCHHSVRFLSFFLFQTLN